MTSHAQDLFVVLDQGGHSSRALVFDAQGKVHAHAAVTIETVWGNAGCIEQDAAEILASLRTVLERVSDLQGSACSKIKCAALIVQRSSLLAWNKHSGQVLSPVLSWQDTRHDAWLQQHMRGHESWLRTQTGLRANAHYGASKMRWLLDHASAVQAASASDLCIGPLAAFLQQQLTQSLVPAVDAVIASRTLLTDLCSLTWSQPLLDFFTLPRAVLPAIRKTTDDYGDLHVGTFSVPLRMLGGDQSFVAFAQGESLFADSIFINAGTGAFIQRAMPIESVPAALLCAPLMIGETQAENRVVAEGTVNAAASALDWLWAEHCARMSVDELEYALAQTRASIPVFSNWVTAGGSPDWLPAARPHFSFQAGLADEAVAVIESIVFGLQRNLDLLQAVKPAGQIVLSGGLSALQGFCQRLADTSGLEVLCSDDTEASARGAAYCLVREFLQERPCTWQLPSVTRFIPAQNETLHARYAAWSAAMSAAAEAPQLSR